MTSSDGASVASRPAGRPKLKADAQRKRVTTRVEPKKRARLIAYAAARGMSIGELIDEHVQRRAVAE